MSIRLDPETRLLGIKFPSKLKITDENGNTVVFDDTETIRIRQELTAIRMILSDIAEANMKDIDVSNLK